MRAAIAAASGTAEARESVVEIPAGSKIAPNKDVR
jgi:hypothetical protein